MKQLFSGRGFAVAGGVAKAVADLIKKNIQVEKVKIKAANGLRECREMSNDAIKGKFDRYLLEVMACPGGCVAGAGCIVKPNIAGNQVKQAAKNSELKISDESKYADKLYLLDEKNLEEE